MQKKKNLPAGRQGLPEAPKSSDWEKGLKTEERKVLYKKIVIWAGIAAACFLGLAGLVALADKTGTNNSVPQENVNLPAPRSTDIQVGKPAAKVVITEYADLQCPACASYNPIVNQLLTEYDGRVRLVFRFFPLRNIHQNALISGQATYAAWKLGKFTEMKDLLFENQASWESLGDPRETFIGYANNLGLKADEFENLMNSNEAKDAVTAGETEALGLGLNSTPSFFIGNKKVVPQGFDGFKQLIDQELK